ncbi:MAG TPA: metallophosphoesterase [Bacillota bacterium]|nr:metallophosphoesterase [Bacillota bacterium]
MPFNSVIDGESALEYSASDEYGKITLTAKIGTEKYIKGRAVKLFCTGSGAQTLVITAKDQAGNVSVFSTQFYLSVASGIDIVHGTVTPTDEAYAVNELQAEVSGQNGTSYSFTVSVPDSAKRIFVRYKASVTTGERTLVSIYNTLSGEYEDVALVCSGEETVIDCALENRAADEKVLFKAEPYVCMGESDTLVWITDTQYYTRYDDLLDEYLSMSAYAASLYMDKKASYLIHSGDIADDYSPLSEAYRQLENALIAHEPFTALGMPFGIVAGNHDVGQAVANFSPFCKYFGASDFDGTSYYGASLDDNVCHYDLVSLGLYDFLFLYIGYYVEADPVVVTWTNAVLANYPDRNAVIVTHSYLDSDGDWLINSENTTDYTHSRAEKIWEDIVVPNENVVAVFCGHVHGAARNLRSVGDTGRQVWEILSDYQFADTQAPTYIVNSMPCDGEGYLRLVSFADGKMTQTTYSPFLDDYNYFSDDSDSFTVDITLSQVRFGMTVDRFEAYVPTQALTSGQAYSGSAVVLSGDYTLSEESQAEDEGRASNMIWIAAAIIAAAAAIASVFYTNRKHHKEMLH